MGLTTFDTLKFVRKLESAGVPSQQAEIQAEALTEAFNVNLDSLVTKEYLAARFAEQKSYMDTRFSEIDHRFRFFYWTQAVVIAAVMIPLFERLAGI